MKLSEETRAARKKAQLSRLAAKGTPDYPALYASQPEQVRIAVEQGAQRKAQREAKDALNQAVLKSSNEAVEVFGNLEVK
jgi:hypothetical protein